MSRADRSSFDFRRIAHQPLPVKATTKPKRGGLRPFRFQSNLKWLLSSIQDGQQAFIEVLRHLPEDFDERAAALIEKWDALTPKDRKSASLDVLCVEAEITPSEAFGWFAAACFDQSLDMMKLIKARAISELPEVLYASIEKAKDIYEGTDERRLLFQAVGFLPTSKGIAIQNNLVEKDTTPAPSMPVFEDQQRRVSTIVRGAPASLPASTHEVIESEPVSEPCIIPRLSTGD